MKDQKALENANRKISLISDTINFFKSLSVDDRRKLLKINRLDRLAGFNNFTNKKWRKDHSVNRLLDRVIENIQLSSRELAQAYEDERTGDELEIYSVDYINNKRKVDSPPSNIKGLASIVNSSPDFYRYFILLSDLEKSQVDSINDVSEEFILSLIQVGQDEVKSPAYAKAIAASLGLPEAVKSNLETLHKTVRTCSQVYFGITRSQFSSLKNIIQDLMGNEYGQLFLDLSHLSSPTIDTECVPCDLSTVVKQLQFYSIYDQVTSSISSIWSNINNLYDKGKLPEDSLELYSRAPYMEELTAELVALHLEEACLESDLLKHLAAKGKMIRSAKLVSLNRAFTDVDYRDLPELFFQPKDLCCGYSYQGTYVPCGRLHPWTPDMKLEAITKSGRNKKHYSDLCIECSTAVSGRCFCATCKLDWDPVCSGSVASNGCIGYSETGTRQPVHKYGCCTYCIVHWTGEDCCCTTCRFAASAQGSYKVCYGTRYFTCKFYFENKRRNKTTKAVLTVDGLTICQGCITLHSWLLEARKGGDEALERFLADMLSYRRRVLDPSSNYARTLVPVEKVGKKPQPFDTNSMPPVPTVLQEAEKKPNSGRGPQALFTKTCSCCGKVDAESYTNLVLPAVSSSEPLKKVNLCEDCMKDFSRQRINSFKVIQSKRTAQLECPPSINSGIVVDTNICDFYGLNDDNDTGNYAFIFSRSTPINSSPALHAYGSAVSYISKYFKSKQAGVNSELTSLLPGDDKNDDVCIIPDFYFKRGSSSSTLLNCSPKDGWPTFMNLVKDVNDLLSRHSLAKATIVIPRGDGISGDSNFHLYTASCLFSFPDRTYLSVKSVSDGYARAGIFSISSLIDKLATQENSCEKSDMEKDDVDWFISSCYEQTKKRLRDSQKHRSYVTSPYATQDSSVVTPSQASSQPSTSVDDEDLQLLAEAEEAPTVTRTKKSSRLLRLLSGSGRIKAKKYEGVRCFFELPQCRYQNLDQKWIKFAPNFKINQQQEG